MRLAVTGLISSTVLLCSCSDLCGNVELARELSPDGSHALVVFERNCGATTGISTQGSIVEAGESLPNKPGNLFVAEEDWLTRPAAHWGDNGVLSLSYPSHFPIRVLSTEVRGIKILVNAGNEAP